MREESRNILGWMGMKREHAILEDARLHVSTTYQTVENFKKVVECYIAGDMEGKKAGIKNVRDCERKADELRAKMVDTLSEGLLMPPDREDLMHFVKSLDRIADWTNGAAGFLNFLEEPLPPEVMDNLSKAADLIFGSISKLKDAVDHLMSNDARSTIDDCHAVDKFETMADDQKKASIEAIIHANLDATKLLLSYQLSEYMEGITDKIEDASEFVKVIAVKSK